MVKTLYDYIYDKLFCQGHKQSEQGTRKLKFGFMPMLRVKTPIDDTFFIEEKKNNMT